MEINKVNLIFIMIILFSFIVCSCSRDMNNTNISDIEQTEPNVKANNVSSFQRSDECDYVLSKGIDSEGNVIELVANKSKSFDENNKIGVIKGNEWIYELNSDNPFIDSNGQIMGIKNSAEHNNYQYEVNKENYIYLGNNCFMLKSFDNTIFWNFVTNSSLVLDSRDYNFELCLRIENDGNYDYMINKVDSDKILCICSAKYKLIDTNTMTFITDFQDYDYRLCSPFSEGLFLAQKGDDISTLGFYNENGTKIIDFSKYENFRQGAITSDEVFFKNGKCTFCCSNKNGVFFKITIDNKGNIISEIQQ